MRPPRTRANSWQDVADLSESFGVKLDPWQELVLQAAMGERPDGTWAAKQIGLSAPRQNGKSQLIVARALAGALLFDERKIVISAHSQDTCRETFAKFLEIRDGCQALEDRIEQVMVSINREFIKFRNGALVQFKARTVSGSRGFSSDCLLLDEAQILGMPAWVSINSTMSARPNPQIWLMGTPPTPEDNGEVFTSIRQTAIAGGSRTLAWLEWSADMGDDPALVETRAKANPAWWTRINHEVVQGEFETYPADRFALDRLGIWLDHLKRDSAFGMGAWEECAVPNLPAAADAIGLAVSVDRSRSSIGSAGLSDGHLSVGAAHRRDGTGWLVPEAKRIQAEYGCPVVVAGTGPAADLIPALEAAGVELTVAKGGDAANACAGIYDAVRERRLAHPDHPELNMAVAGAHKRMGAEGRWVWDRRNSEYDISMLEAVTLAAWGAVNVPTGPLIFT